MAKLTLAQKYSIARRAYEELRDSKRPSAAAMEKAHEKYTKARWAYWGMLEAKKAKAEKKPAKKAAKRVTKKGDRKGQDATKKVAKKRKAS